MKQENEKPKVASSFVTENTNETKIDTTQLAKGIYFLIDSKGNVYKFIKQ